MVRLPKCSAKAVLVVIACGGMLCALWTRVVAPAHDAARRSQCHNNLFQHSGWHPSDIVLLDQGGNVVSVSSCPLCCTSAAPTVYRNANGRYFAEEELPPQSVEAARQQLVQYKAESRYRSVRGAFGVGNETQAELRARALWDQFQ